MKTKIKFVKDSHDFLIKTWATWFIDWYWQFWDFCAAIIIIDWHDYPVISWIREMEYIIIK